MACDSVTQYAAVVVVSGTKTPVGVHVKLTVGWSPPYPTPAVYWPCVPSQVGYPLSLSVRRRTGPGPNDWAIVYSGQAEPKQTDGPYERANIEAVPPEPAGNLTDWFFFVANTTPTDEYEVQMTYTVYDQYRPDGTELCSCGQYSGGDATAYIT